MSKDKIPDDAERLLTELLKRRTIGPESRKDRTLINYLTDQKFDEGYVNHVKTDRKQHGGPPE